VNRRTRGRAGALAVIAVLVTACGSTAPTTIPTTPTTIPTTPPTATPSPTVPSTPGATLSVSPSGPPSFSPSPGSSGQLTFDESLLSVLPADIDGLGFEPDPDALADLDAETLGQAADRVAFAVISDVESGELAVTSILHLRDGAFGDAFFRSYRDSYDAAACEPVGGKSGNAEAQIGGHETFIGTCGSGTHTYHVYLPDQRTIVSVVSVGEIRKFGERIVEGLQD
jgi:hypothetical protein